MNICPELKCSRRQGCPHAEPHEPNKWCSVGCYLMVEKGKKQKLSCVNIKNIDLRNIKNIGLRNES